MVCQCKGSDKPTPTYWGDVAESSGIVNKDDGVLEPSWGWGWSGEIGQDVVAAAVQSLVYSISAKALTSRL